MSAASPTAALAPTTAPAASPAPVPTAAIKPAEEVTDQQTGKVFKKLPEQWYDVTSAWISAIYSLAVIAYLAFMLLYMLSGKYAFWPEALTNRVANLLTGPISKVILYTAIGGAMGAAVNNLRSFISWHAEEKAFGWRFVWKYVAMPPLGGTLAVLVYGILQGGMAVINGGSGPSNNQLTSLSAWATGTLAGYGSSKVFIWLDDKVNTLFKIDKKQVAVPNLAGQLSAQAKQMISTAQLTVGTVSAQQTTSDQVGKVISQTPAPGTELDCGSTVNLVVGTAAPAENVDPAVNGGLSHAPQNGSGTSTKKQTETGTADAVGSATEVTANKSVAKETSGDKTATTETTEEPTNK